MPCRRLGLALLVLVLGAWPAAADVGALLGKRIVDVRVDAGGVAVTDPNVLTLVETRLGDALTMAGVRQTIEHFVTLGRYADVRVFGEPDGADAVRLRYEVVPVERVMRLEFQGPAGLDARALRSDLTDRFLSLIHI